MSSFQTQLILASTSPRRVELMAQAGLRAQSLAPDCDESLIRGESPKQMVLRLALTKAHSVALRLKPVWGKRYLVIGADTTVVAPQGEKILGKPRNPAEARRMLRMISGQTHEVLTGFAVIEISSGGRRKVIRSVSSKVSLRPLSAAQIRAYVEMGEPMDKAGAYAAQGRGMNFITSIRGSYTNVVGLPMAELLEVLEKEFGVPVLV